MRRFLLLFLLVLVAGCNVINRPLPDTNTSLAPSLDGLDENAIRKGDLIAVNYVLKLEDGTVVDTNNAVMAREAGLKNYATGPYKFIIGESNKLRSFDEAFMGKHSGENSTVKIYPIEPEQTARLPREQTFKRNVKISAYQRFPLNAFEKLFKKPAVIRDVVFAQQIPWKYQVLNVTNSSVYAKIVTNTGEKVKLEGTYWDSTVLTVLGKEIMIRQSPDDNQEIQSPLGKAKVNVYPGYFNITYNPEIGSIVNHSVQIGNSDYSTTLEYEVREVNDDAFLLRRHNYLPQEKLVLEYEILDVVKSVK